MDAKRLGQTLKPVLVVARRFLAVGSILILAWVAIGAIWFPEWWYRFFWDPEVKGTAYLQGGSGYLLTDQAALLTVLCVAVIATTVSFRFIKARLYTALDRWGLQITTICACAFLAVILLLYRTQHELAEAKDDILRFAEASGANNKGWNWPPIEPPVAFRYLDGPRVTGLYSEIESEFVEKERTVSSERSSSLALGGGDSKAEGSGKSTETSSYQRQNLTTERRCLELMNFLLSKGRIPYYTTAQEVQSHELERIRKSNEELARFASDNAIFDQSVRGLVGFPKRWKKIEESIHKPQSKEDQRLTEEQASRMMQFELAQSDGLLIVDGIFHSVASAAGRSFEMAFGNAPRRIAFRFTIREKQKFEPVEDGARLRVFGPVTHQFGNTGYIEISPVAVF